MKIKNEKFFQFTLFNRNKVWYQQQDGAIS